MRERLLRIVLVLQAVGSGVVGAWALLWPRAFYDSFPGGGRGWVSVDGPYNEHLVRDVGALNLALVVMTVAALWRLTPTIVRAAALASLTFAVPHFVYHAAHLDRLAQSDKWMEASSLLTSILLACVALWLVVPTTPNTAPDRLP